VVIDIFDRVGLEITVMHTVHLLRAMCFGMLVSKVPAVPRRST
jgi:hypothetical protein